MEINLEFQMMLSAEEKNKSREELGSAEGWDDRFSSDGPSRKELITNIAAAL